MATDVAKKAVQTAYQYLISVSPVPKDYFSNFRLEEITENKDGKFIITLSYDVQGDFAFDKKREYKEFEVAKNGETVLSMKIRKV